MVGREKPASQGADFHVRPDGGSPGSLFRAMRVLSVSSRGISEDATRAIWRCRLAGGLETVVGTQRRRLRARCRGRALAQRIRLQRVVLGADVHHTVGHRSGGK